MSREVVTDPHDHGGGAGTRVARPEETRRAAALRDGTVLFVIVCAAFLVRSYDLGATDFWNDETYTAVTSTHGHFLDSLTAIEHSPPLYFLIARLWAGFFGASENSLRSLSVLLGLVAVAVAWLLGSDMGGRRAGIWSALGVALAPHLVVQSREARGYIFIVAPLLLAAWGAARVAEHDERRGWLALVLGGTACIFTHYVSVIFIFAIVLSLLLASPRRAVFLSLGAWCLAGVVLLIPWLPHMRRQLFTDSYFLEAQQAIPVRTAILDGVHFLPRLLTWSTGYNLPPELYSILYYPLSLVLGAAVVFAAWRLHQAGRRIYVLMPALLLAVSVTAYGSGRAREMIYYLGVEAVLLICLAFASSRDRRFLPGFLAILLIGTLGTREALVGRFHLEDRLQRARWKEAARMIANGYDPGDAVMVPAGWPSSLGWYLRDRTDIPLYQLWRDSPYFRRIAPYARITPGDPATVADSVIAGKNRIWFVEFREGLQTDLGSIRGALNSRFTDSRVFLPVNPRVTLYADPRSPDVSESEPLR
jgi:4-amino-4-deoxy-L-arabinose transferase-like glycosyltransferase